MPIYGKLILQSIRCSPTLWAVTQPSQFRSIMDKDEFVREPQITLYVIKRILSSHKSGSKPHLFQGVVVIKSLGHAISLDIAGLWCQ